MGKIISFDTEDVIEAKKQLETTANQMALKTNNGVRLTDADLDAFFEDAAEVLNAKENARRNKKSPY